VHYGKISIEFEYSNCLYRHPPETVASEKYLGVVFSTDLKVRRQCEEAYSKASQMELWTFRSQDHSLPGSQRRIDSVTSVNGHPITTGNYIYKDQKDKICGEL